MTRIGPAGLGWRMQAACAQTGAGDDWFPPARSRVDPLVLRVCTGCPVWRDCLLYVIARPEIWDGIWAGLTPREVAGLRARLLHREVGADLPAQALQIVLGRASTPRYGAAVPHPLPGYRHLRRQRRRLLTRLRAAGLFDGNGDGSRGAAA